MAELKTQPNEQSVLDFLESNTEGQRRADCLEVMRLMEEITGCKGVMWGPSIVGFGSYHYKYESGREADWLLTGFSPRKANLTVYIMDGFERHADLMERLGTYKTGKSCLYLKKLADVDTGVLNTLIERSVRRMKEMYPD